MHDDIPLTTGRARRVLDERILPAVHGVSVPLEVAWNALPGEPIPPAEGLALDYAPYALGTPWGPAWGTTWFRLTGTVPAEWAGRRVEVVADLGFDANMPGFQCEGLVYRADGSPVKSLNPRNQWILIAEEAVGGETVELYVEAAANPVLLDYHPFLPTREGDILTSSRAPLYTTRRIDVAVFESEVHELALDVEVLLELQAELPEGPRRMRILQALDDALDTLDLQRIPETAAAARAALVPALSAPADASAHRISAIGHAHIDSAWLWPVRETVRKVARTTSSMTDLIDQTDDFLYGMSSAQQYAWVKEHRPEVWTRIVAAVAAGRFLPLGGMWVESDTVMPTGEALVRQFTQGQRFFREEFGIAPKGVWLPDSFGYSPALPQLMRRAGFEWFFTQKISWNQVNTFPHHTFLWEGIDGSQVFSHFPPMDTYNSRLAGEEVAKASRQFRENRRATGSIAPVGWGDGGGGTTREMVGKAARLADLEGSARVRWEHPDAFFDRARAELPAPPVWVGELYLELHRATLTSQHRTKQGNRRAEHLLVEAEVWCSAAALRTGEPYPYERLDALWRQVLLLQFHDILPGTSIAWVHREAAATYAQVVSELQGLIRTALSALVGEGDMPLVANPASAALGTVAPYGIASSGDGDPAVRLAETAEGFVLENALVRVAVSREGLVTSAVDLATGRDAVAPGHEANLLQLHQDFPNMWDAWDVDRFYRNRVEDIRSVDAIDAEVGSDGVARVVVRRSFSASTVEQTLSLAPASRTLEIAQSTDWHETEKFLKVAFPLDVRAEHTIAETQFGAQKRVTHTNTSWEAAKFETSMHRFVLVEEPGFGVALVNDSVYGYDTERAVTDGDVVTTLRLSLLRAPRFPDPETDQGVQTHRYGLLIGATLASATDAGILLNQDARPLTGGREVAPLVTVEGGAVLSAVKLADDGSGDLVVRLYEPAGQRATARLRVDAAVTGAHTATLLEEPLAGLETAVDGSFDLALSPFEVRTLRFAPVVR
ncbi:alpha-mannosidase [Leifsonia sp. ZF2019]|uniref:alpha-mannosidase n=1 Tax=Leifsonia sp. ZF2019 TaxID=2781978 RepID=UPI001CBB19A8|nr:glycoside hydrolase family 38 C-terminal domain-containing protein [Leifsonia sp. ZF2019]UAJ79368.1 alpha-mannosidase [Leifsonia sp. ZF2019]